VGLQELDPVGFLNSKDTQLFQDKHVDVMAELFCSDPVSSNA